MSLYLQLVFAMLVFEMALFLLLLIPLPLQWRAKLLKSISKSKIFGHIKYTMRILFVFVLILFIDSVMKQNKHSEHDHHHHHENEQLQLNAKKFYAQRNMYLTGSVLFLSLVLDRFYQMVLELVLKQQAVKQSKELLKLMDQDQETKAKLDLLDDKDKEIARLTRDLDALKKQAESVNDEYMKLLDKSSKEDKKSK
ncbi:B-cell receptor-associated protein 31-like-domain-containing protein [Gorgonomyces haynaldii]|nr:B-cell receptor-associated protein 31-like-domain-containing protein [Gorgonomyces haynaldii]